MPSFNFDGKKYRAASSHQKEWGTRLITELSLTGNETILDLGCGDGILTAKLAELVPQGKVIGIDNSPGMINTAKELERSNLEFYLMDITQIHYCNTFDIIFSNATLHWIKDHTTLISNCYTALKPAGILRFNFAGQGNCLHFFTVMKEVIRTPRYQLYFTGFVWPWYMPNIAEYQNIIAQFPFQEVKVWEENADKYFSHSDEMVKWIDQPSLVPFIKVVDEQDKSSFRDIVVAKMIQQTLQNDGRCFETFRRINVFAIK